MQEEREAKRKDDSQEENLSSAEDLVDLDEFLFETQLARSDPDSGTVASLDLVRLAEKEGEEGSDGGESDEDDVGVGPTRWNDRAEFFLSATSEELVGGSGGRQKD